MKKIALAITAVVLCILALFGCNKTGMNIQEKNVSSSAANSSVTDSSVKKENIYMTFAKLPSPPKCKKVKDQATINKVTEYIDSYEKVPIENRKEKGGQILITITLPEGKMKQYTVVGDKLQIDNACYKISKNLISDLEKLYDQIDVPEEKY
jgi:hypothetical protein